MLEFIRVIIRYFGCFIYKNVTAFWQ